MTPTTERLMNMDHAELVGVAEGLLGALRGLLDRTQYLIDCPDCGLEAGPYWTEVHTARAAIAKAEGRS